MPTLSLTAKVAMKQFRTPKVKHSPTVMKKTTMAAADSRLLERLSVAAKSARARVSEYSDQQRSELEKFARNLIHSAKAEQVCRS